jgi:hypothetical protein
VTINLVPFERASDLCWEMDRNGERSVRECLGHSPFKTDTMVDFVEAQGADPNAGGGNNHSERRQSGGTHSSGVKFRRCSRTAPNRILLSDPMLADCLCQFFVPVPVLSDFLFAGRYVGRLNANYDFAATGNLDRLPTLIYPPQNLAQEKPMSRPRGCPKDSLQVDVSSVMVGRSPHHHLILILVDFSSAGCGLGTRISSTPSEKVALT